MGKSYIDSVKYEITASFVVDGIVEKPDVVGAVFGQTEGLLGEELELRDLQKNGRIGRIEVEMEKREGKTFGKIIVPSGLDIAETCIVAAALETVDRVGPCEARITVDRIVDRRETKREYILKRARELLMDFVKKELPDARELVDRIKTEAKMAEIVKYGPEGLNAGPGVDSSDSIILVEGRADVLNLLRNDITNVIEIGGLKIPKTIVELCERKEATAFLDGDRGGEMILDALLRAGASVDYVARAPPGREVEELTRKEIVKALRNRMPVEKKDPLKTALRQLRGSLKARFYDSGGKVLREVPVREMIRALENTSGVAAVVFDGVITQRLLDTAAARGVRKILAVKMGNVAKVPEGVEVHTEE